MGCFRLISIRHTKEIKKYNNDFNWKRSTLLPYYREGYVCFSRNKDYSYEELKKLFIYGNDDEQIGAISVIAECFPNELYQSMCDDSCYIPVKRINYLLDYVIPNYLPLILPKEQLVDYNFSDAFFDDIWVRILAEIKLRLNR